MGRFPDPAGDLVEVSSTRFASGGDLLEALGDLGLVVQARRPGQMTRRFDGLSDDIAGRRPGRGHLFIPCPTAARLQAAGPRLLGTVVARAPGGYHPGW
jgi:hypothetical protein